MRIQVVSQSADALKSASYDLSIFASGYEMRARNIAGQMDSERLGRVIVFGFSERIDHVERKRNDEFFFERFGQAPIVCESNDDSGILDTLRHVIKSLPGTARILVDYSSMSRVWYAAIISWFRFANESPEIHIDFCYSAGAYEGDYPFRIVRQVVAMPGLEGVLDEQRQSIAIFGLGFDGMSPLAVVDDLEPDEMLGFFAANDANNGSLDHAREMNAEFLRLAENRFAVFPLMDVAYTTRQLEELVASAVASHNVLLVPLGPKPHVLASILCALRYPSVACLHAIGSAESDLAISAMGPISVTGVSLQTDID